MSYHHPSMLLPVRKIVVSLVLALSATGLLVGFGGALGLERPITRALSLLHYWGGLFFVVLFPLYAWDHIRENRHWLRVVRLTSVSGVFQASVGALLLLSGLVIIVYGGAVWREVRTLHNWLTYPLVAALAVHYLARKDWR